MRNQKPSAPCVLGLNVLLNNFSYYAVRMVNVDEVENISEQGEMLWPEFLICTSEVSAGKLRDFLNDLSYLDSRSIWIEEEPYLEEEELKQRWREDGIGIYEVIFVENLSSHPDIHRIPQSLTILKNLKQPIDFI